MLKKLPSLLDKGLEKLEQFTLDVIYEQQKDGAGIKAYGKMLSGLSTLYSGVVRSRKWLYDNGILRRDHPGCLVIVVGNLTVGGTGKTPVVEKFARALKERGRKVAILSRGYKSKQDPLRVRLNRRLNGLPSQATRVVSEGNGPLMDAESAGDEPYMLAKNLPGVLVLVDKDRLRSGAYAIKQYGADALLLDDGFQYLKLKEQLNLLLIDAGNPFGNGRLLPRGVLREPIRHIERASYVFLTKCTGQSNQPLKDLIHQYKPGIEIIECQHKPQYLCQVNGEKQLPLEFLKGKRVAIFSGIADPKSFEASLIGFGAEVVYRKHFVDHHYYSAPEIDAVFENAQKDQPHFFVTTEKDAVRLGEDFEASQPLYFLRLEIDILNGSEDFQKAVDRICFPKNKPHGASPTE